MTRDFQVKVFKLDDARRFAFQEVGLVGASAGPAPVEDYTLTVAVVRKKCLEKVRLFAQI